MAMPTPGRPIRWRGAVLIVAAAAAALAWIWLTGEDADNQGRVHLTGGIIVATALLLALWLFFLSGFSRAARRRIGAAAALLLALAAVSVRVRGVTGDLVPIFEWRWAAREAPSSSNPATLPVPDTAPTATVSVPDTAPTPTVSVPGTGREPVSDTERAPRDPGASFPQFMGPGRDGVVAGVQLASDWDASPPRLVWRRQVGAGWSGFAVADGIAVTQEQRGDKESVVAYRLADGAPLWSHGDAANYESTVAGNGPRATPTIDRGRVFTLGSTGILNALDLKTGARLWTTDVTTGNDSGQPDWGRSSSPLAVDDLVVVSVGGSGGHSLVAYHRDSGAVVWYGGDDAASYSSPQLLTLAGVRQIVILNKDSAAGHDVATGRVLWRHEWPRLQPSVAQPLSLGGDRVLFSAGYGNGSRALQISAAGGALEARLLWESTRMKAKFASLVEHAGHVYGLDDGVLASLDPATGERPWKAGRYGHGQLLLAGGVLLVQTEDGEIVLVEPRPDAHRELTRFRVFDRKTWNPPALAGRRLIVRNDAEAACYELPVR